MFFRVLLRFERRGSLNFVQHKPPPEFRGDFAPSFGAAVRLIQVFCIRINTHRIERVPCAILSLMHARIILLASLAVLAPIATNAAVTDVAVSAEEIQIVPPLPIAHAPLKVYGVIHNNGTADVEGIVTFAIDGVVIAQKPISLRASGVPEEVWAAWTPSTSGTSVVRISIAIDGAPDENPENNVARLTFLVAPPPAPPAKIKASVATNQPLHRRAHHHLPCRSFQHQQQSRIRQRERRRLHAKAKGTSLNQNCRSITHAFIATTSLSTTVPVTVAATTTETIQQTIVSPASTVHTTKTNSPSDVTLHLTRRVRSELVS